MTSMWCPCWVMSRPEKGAGQVTRVDVGRVGCLSMSTLSITDCQSLNLVSFISSVKMGKLLVGYKKDRDPMPDQIKVARLRDS